MGWRCFSRRFLAPACCFLMAGAFFLAGEDVLPRQNSILPVSAEQPAGEVIVEARVESTVIPLNRFLTLKVTATCLGDMNRYEFRWPNPPELDRFEIAGSAEANVVADQAGQIQTSREFRYILKPTGKGSGRIGSVSLLYVDRLTQKEHSLSTRAISVDITGPVAEGGDKGRLMLWLSIVLVAAMGVALFLFFLRKRRVPAGVVSPENIQSPAELALEELETVPSLRLEGEIRESFSVISNACRRYIDRTFAFRTAELTTRDIMDHLRAGDLAEEAVQKIETILDTCDVVKYAPHQPSGDDLDRILVQAKECFTGKKGPLAGKDEGKAGPEA